MCNKQGLARAVLPGRVARHERPQSILKDCLLQSADHRSHVALHLVLAKNIFLEHGTAPEPPVARLNMRLVLERARPAFVIGLSC